MTEENTQKNNDTNIPNTATKPVKDFSKKPFNNTRGGYRGNKKSGSNFERPKPEFDQKMIDVRRVTRVVAGGRRMSFAVALAIGDKKGSIGLGTGKGTDTALAIGKALKQARKNMFKIKTTKNMSIPHDVSVKYASSRLNLMPNKGKGLVAGSTVRDMLVLAGITNVTAKIHSRSKNKLNNARAAYNALYIFKSNEKRIIPELKDKKVNDK